MGDWGAGQELIPEVERHYQVAAGDNESHLVLCARRKYVMGSLPATDSRIKNGHCVRVVWVRECVVGEDAGRTHVISDVAHDTVPYLRDSAKVGEAVQRHSRNDLAEKLIGLEDRSAGWNVLTSDRSIPASLGGQGVLVPPSHVIAFVVRNPIPWHLDDDGCRV